MAEKRNPLPGNRRRPASGRAATARHVGGDGGAAATAHPSATSAAVDTLAAGGSAVDAAIAAQAVICVVSPQAAGLGGDVLALVSDDGRVSAVNGTGCSPRGLVGAPATTGGTSVAVPGLVDGWLTLHARWGRLPLGVVLSPAVRLAGDGITVDDHLADALSAQVLRLLDGGAEAWSLLSHHGDRGDGPWRQPELARLLTLLAEQGREAFYAGPAAAAIEAAVRRHGGMLDRQDLAGHRTPCPPPVSVPWRDGRAYVQPPMSQGVLLAAALQAVERLERSGVPVDDHVLVEVTEAAFALRSSCSRGTALLQEELAVDLERASGRGGPRSYLHTAGVATADGHGQVVSSLVSVFDDFGSGVFVPELGIVLNNRAAGFTDGENSPAPGKRPVHTLAPAMLTSADGTLGIATPGADGQVQTLLQVLDAAPGRPLTEAVSGPRWRSQDGRLLVEEGHPASLDLSVRGHRTVTVEAGSDVFGAVVAAGLDPAPFAVADWRRQTTSGAVA